MLPRTWIFQASPRFSNVKGAVRSIEDSVCLVHQHRKEIKPGDQVYLWECGARAGIIAVAQVIEEPRIQPEPPEQLPFIREGEKFAGAQLRVRLRIVKQISPVFPRKYLFARRELAGLSVLRCPRGTNFRVTPEQTVVLEKVVRESRCSVCSWYGGTIVLRICANWDVGVGHFSACGAGL